MNPPGQGWSTNPPVVRDGPQTDTADGHNHQATNQMMTINVAGISQEMLPKP